MTRRKTRIADIELDKAVWPWRPMVETMEIDRADQLLRMPRSRPPVLPEKPVDVSRVLGRAPEEWEAFLIIEARRHERERERRLVT